MNGVMSEHSKALFWMQVRRTPGGCWEWQGATNGSGYGVISVRNVRDRLAHRIAYELCKGVALQAHGCHLCNNPRCVNAAHIFDGDDAANMAHARECSRTCSGSRNVHAKLSEAEVRRIRGELSGGEKQSVVARKHNVSISLISMIHRRIIWTHV